MKTKIVKLKLYFNRSISTRVAVQNLFCSIRKGVEDVVFDFSDIYFISSSASHQFIIEVKALEKQKVSVSYINLENDVERMLSLAKTDRKNIFTVQDIKHLNIISNKDISTILLEA